MPITIKFVCNHKVDAHDGAEYTEGQIVSFPDTKDGRASADHFLKRQLAVETATPRGRPPKAEAAPAPPPTKDHPKEPAKEPDKK